MKILALLTLASLAGCTNGEFTPTAESQAAALAAQARKGAARQALFEKCMTLAAALPRQSGDDASRVVSECSNQAWYMVQHMP